MFIPAITFLGTTYRQAEDVYPNAKAFVGHLRLINNGSEQVSVADVDGLRLKYNGGKYRSDLFLFHDYEFNFYDPQEGGVWQAEIHPISQPTSPLVGNFIYESVERLSVAVTMLALVIFSFPIWSVLLAVAALTDYSKTRAVIIDAWNRSWPRVVS